MRRTGLVPLCVLLSLSCATAQPTPTISVSEDEARKLTADFETQVLKADAADPLMHPSSLDDVLKILKRDQMDLFPGGVEYASKSTDPKAKALEAQIELSWGEAQLILSELLTGVSSDLGNLAHKLDMKQAAGALSEAKAKQLFELHATIKSEKDLADALAQLAAEHVARGATMAQAIIAASPSDYVGYRLAGDYYRLRGDWNDFDAMIAKLEATNPNSNGLVFLKAMNEISRQGRGEEGREMLRKALEKDHEFVRAEAELVLTSRTPDERYNTLLELQKLNPRHQIVTWLGPGITQAYQSELRDDWTSGASRHESIGR